MKTKKQTEKQELKYAPSDKVVYHCAGVDREGLIAYVDDSDNVAPEPKPEETQMVESIQEEEPQVEPTLVEKYQAFKSTINMAEFNDLVDLVTADTKKMRELMAKSMQSIANDCGLKA